MSTAKCSLGPKHKWVWVRDIVIKNMTMNARGTTVRISERGEFKCACGGVRHGASRGGL